MDQMKIGRFLKDLRKGNNLTQEQLSEQLNVSARTVSRWETGNNLPDLSILVEIADFYDVDIRDIINGERKSEKVNDELKDTLRQVAEYSNEEKTELRKNLLKKVFIVVTFLVVLGAICYLAFANGENFGKFLYMITHS